LSVAWNGDDYQRRFDALAASGAEMHGEVAFVMTYSPATVLDAGCGTGRVAIELDRRGVAVVGSDVDASMLDTARRRADHIEWVESDLTELDLGRTFDVVVMAGNVPLFTPPGTQPALVAGVARHVGSGGRLISGFSVDRGYGAEQFDADAAAAGLELEQRWSTWDGQPFDDTSDYAVSVHRPRLED
jgi:SAM-dependent methyltransferase